VLGTDVPLTFEALKVGPITPREVRSPGYAGVGQVRRTIHKRFSTPIVLEPGAGTSPPRRGSWRKDDDSSEEVRPKYLTAPTTVHEMDRVRSIALILLRSLVFQVGIPEQGDARREPPRS